DLEDLAGVVDGLEARAKDLWDAPEGVGVLYPVRPLVALHDLAGPQELQHVPRDEVLADLLLQVGETCVEGRGAAAERLEAHRRGDLRVLQKLQGVRDEEAAEARHDRGAVQDREAL